MIDLFVEPNLGTYVRGRVANTKFPNRHICSGELNSEWKRNEEKILFLLFSLCPYISPCLCRNVVTILEFTISFN